MSTATITGDEMQESLTGYDEIAITKHFDVDIYMDGDTKPITIARGLVFVYQTRQGMKPNEAKDFAMSMALKDVMEFFPDNEDEPMPEEPVTESGKDDSGSEFEPTN